METQNPDRGPLHSALPDVKEITRPPRVSFAIPVCNAERFLGRAMDSLLAQDFEGRCLRQCLHRRYPGSHAGIQ